MLPFFLKLIYMTDKLINYLEQFITARRIKLFNSRLNYRTRYLTVVLEDIYQPHNASAVLRSCECFGVQDVHIIENRNTYRISPDVALGSHKWLTLKRHNTQSNNTRDALEALKNEGYRIVAATPHRKDCQLEDLDLRKGKVALVFGSELEGLSSTALELAEEFVRIPMAGFTESLNISVSAAICIHFLTNNLRKSDDLAWPLTEEEKKKLKLVWLKNSIKKSDLIERGFLDDHHINADKGIINSETTPG